MAQVCRHNISAKSRSRIIICTMIRVPKKVIMHNCILRWHLRPNTRPLLCTNHLSTSYTKSTSKRSKYSKYFATLELPDDSSQDLVRRKYIDLVKKYHPDSPEGKQNQDKFRQVDQAYRELQRKFREDKARDEASIGEYGLYYTGPKGKQEEEEDEREDPDHPDIRHTAPQHRQYLSHDGLGLGTPSQRQDQYQKYRVLRATDSVHRHRVNKLTATDAAEQEHEMVAVERRHSRRHKTKGAMDRLVEDLISESMARGEFDNLKGSGQPLQQRVNYNPYSDFTTHKINEILVEGGFAPEWILLKKEIRQDADRIRESLGQIRRTLGANPLGYEDRKRWEGMCRDLAENEVKNLNKTIDRYNLLVPMLSGQLFHFDLEREAAKVMLICRKELEVERAAPEKEKKKEEEERTKKWFEILSEMLRRSLGK